MTGCQRALIASLAVHGVLAVLPYHLPGLAAAAPSPVLQAPPTPATPTLPAIAAAKPPEPSASREIAAPRSAGTSSATAVAAVPRSPEPTAVALEVASASSHATGPVPVAYANNPPPTYPRFARERGQSGRVLLAVQVGTDGRPRNVALQASSGYALLDKAALEAVVNWQFVPGQHDGQAIDATVEVPIVFNLAMR